MDYDILKKSAGLVADDRPLEARLGDAAALFIASLPSFDVSSIYLVNDAKMELELKAVQSKKGVTAKSNAAVFKEDAGLGWVAIKTGRSLHALSKEAFPATGAVWNNIKDSSLGGFKSVYVAVLGDLTGCYGVVYLKSLRRAALDEEKRELVRLLAFHTAMAVKFDRLFRIQMADYGEVKALQKKLAGAERLMALGDMAASIAHEIKNPLISLGGFASRLKKKLGPDSPHQQYVELMLGEIARIEKIMNGAVRHLRDSLLEITRSDLSEILEETAGIFEDDFKSRGIGVVREFHDGPMPVDVDREQLKIAFDNLIANAIQSMKHGGVLRLRTVLSGIWAVAEISDSGGGIDPRYEAQIFNPFFTTKDDGTGLGLPITNSIIMRHHGVIGVINDVGVGATFMVKLPLAA